MDSLNVFSCPETDSAPAVWTEEEAGEGPGTKAT